MNWLHLLDITKFTFVWFKPFELRFKHAFKKVVANLTYMRIKYAYFEQKKIILARANFLSRHNYTK